MIWEVPGFAVGHWSDPDARTGCTAVLALEPVVASGEVRGSAPATREFALLDPSATVQRIDAVVLSGGSAFGLAAGDGAMDWLEDHDRGFPTDWGRVPIVVGMSLFDLGVGDATVRPSATDGHAATAAAATSPVTDLGRIGAGTGATTSKWRGPDAMVRGGLGGAVQRHGDLVVAALVAVNAWGDIEGSASAALPRPALDGAHDAFSGTNTVIGVVGTNADLDKVGCLQMARGAHDGLARAVFPPHATPDGDAFVAMATGQVEAPADMVRMAVVGVVEEAIRGVADDDGDTPAPVGSAESDR